MATTSSSNSNCIDLLQPVKKSAAASKRRHAERDGYSSGCQVSAPANGACEGPDKRRERFCQAESPRAPPAERRSHRGHDCPRSPEREAELRGSAFPSRSLGTRGKRELLHGFPIPRRSNTPYLAAASRRDRCRLHRRRRHNPPTTLSLGVN
jgi:hypothetical protein